MVPGREGRPMPSTHSKVTATVSRAVLAQLDALVAAHVYPSRSAAIDAALTALLRLHMDAYCRRSGQAGAGGRTALGGGRLGGLSEPRGRGGQLLILHRGAIHRVRLSPGEGHEQQGQAR